jgi:hypothetical protein
MTRPLLVGLLACCASFGADSYGIPLTVLPTTPTAVLSIGVKVTQIILVNTNDAADRTVTVSNAAGVVFIKALIHGVSSQSNHLIISYPSGLPVQGGITWSADGSGVTGELESTR